MAKKMEIIAPFQEVIDEIREKGGEAVKYCYQCGKCDMCEDEPPLEKPLCVQWCLNDALIYEEREEEVEESVEMEDVEAGLTSMIDKYGMDKISDVLTRMSQKDQQ